MRSSRSRLIQGYGKQYTVLCPRFMSSPSCISLLRYLLGYAKLQRHYTTLLTGRSTGRIFETTLSRLMRYELSLNSLDGMNSHDTKNLPHHRLRPQPPAVQQRPANHSRSPGLDFHSSALIAPTTVSALDHLEDTKRVSKD